MQKYYSTSRVESEIRKLEYEPGDTTLQKCLFFLTRFVYKEIEEKRRNALDTMILACQTGLQENGNEELKDFIYLYFNSKYAKLVHEIDGVNYSLTEDTMNATDYTIDTIWKFIDATIEDPSGAQKDNTKHLRGATIRLLRTGQTNAALLLLKAYSLFVLGTGVNESLAVEARNSMLLGLKMLRQKYTELSYEQLDQIVQKYKMKIIDNGDEQIKLNQELDSIIDQFYIGIHNDWLDNFNKKYLENYV